MTAAIQLVKNDRLNVPGELGYLFRHIYPTLSVDCVEDAFSKLLINSGFGIDPKPEARLSLPHSSLRLLRAQDCDCTAHMHLFSEHAHRLV